MMNRSDIRVLKMIATDKYFRNMVVAGRESLRCGANVKERVLM